MTLGTILYIFLFFVSVFISIMYLEFGAMALMGLMVTIPVCMFLFLLVLRKRVSVSVDSKNPLAEKDAIDKPARAAITLSVENKSHLLPVTKGIAKVRYENPFSGDKGKMKIRFSVDTGKKRDRRIPVVMDNCGNVSITVEKVRIYDYLNIFAWTIGKHFETQDVLVLPPKIAPIQVIVLPVAMHKAGVLEKASELKDRLVKAGLRVKLDDSDNSMGWKCAQYEMKGVPVRVEIGPRDIEAGQCVLVRRNDGEKTVVPLENLEAAVSEQLELVQKGMFEKAKKNLDEHIYEAHSLEEARQLQAEHGGFIKTMWCGELECELKMKEEGGMSSRCMPLKQEHLGDTCPICGKPARKMIYWGIAY